MDPAPAGSAVMPVLRVISSMATRQLLVARAGAFGRAAGIEVDLMPMGGVEAARRVREGEACDVVVLGADAIDRLQQSGQLDAGARVDWVRSGIAVAVPADAPPPDLSSEAAVRRAVAAAKTIGYSTGPSGVALVALFARWGLADLVAAKAVQAPPGVPVGSLVARGEVALGFQQYSELIGLDGIALVGMLPDEIQVWTTFSAAVARTAADPAVANAFLQSLVDPATAETVRRHGMALLSAPPDSR